jgi:hypothetical protein
LHIRRIRAVTAGHSASLSIEEDSTLYWDLEDNYYLTSRCENLQIDAPTTGTLTVEARAEDGSASNALVFFATTGDYTTGQTRKPGTATVGVAAGKRYLVFIGVPVGVTQRLDVSTTLR